MDGLPLVRRVPDACDGMRLDAALARMLPQFSRRQLQDWMRAGQVLAEGEPVRVRDPARRGERVEIWPQAAAPSACVAQNLPLHVVHADADVIVLDKPAGLVMHPAPGHPDGTVQNALLFHFPETARLPRAGLVHRLDRDTTGLVAVARSAAAQVALVRQLQARTMQRRYQALVRGELVAGGVIDAPIGRHPRARQRMCVRAGGREARTHYRVRQRFAGLTLLELRLETGRTHQIRVHLAHQGHPVVGDPVYGGRARVPAGFPPAVRACVGGFARQALHAWALELEHPASGERCAWEVPLPEDLRALLASLEAQNA